MRDFLYNFTAVATVLSIVPLILVFLPMFVFWDVSVVTNIYIRGCIGIWLVISLLATIAVYDKG